MQPKADYALLAIVGLTASGKTALGIRLAKKLNGEVICADSRTVYKHMDIGTAKPTLEEMQGIRHHLLDLVEPDQPFTVADFKHLAFKAVDDIRSRGKLPILVGGSGLYIDVVLFDYDFAGASGERDTQNPRHRASGSAHSRSKLMEGAVVIGLQPNRDELRQKLERRVDQMVENGFVEEVKSLLTRYSGVKALSAPGYRAFVEYIGGEISLAEAKEIFVLRDYQLARRQMTWFRRNTDINWFTSAEEAEEFVLS